MADQGNVWVITRGEYSGGLTSIAAWEAFGHLQEGDAVFVFKARCYCHASHVYRWFFGHNPDDMSRCLDIDDEPILEPAGPGSNVCLHLEYCKSLRVQRAIEYLEECENDWNSPHSVIRLEQWHDE